MVRSVNSKSIIKSVFQKNWISYFIGIVLAGGTSYLSAQIPGLLGDAVNALSDGNNDFNAVKTAAILMIAAASGAFAARFIWRFLIIGTTRKIELNLRMGLFGHLQSQSGDFYVKYNTGDIITRSISDINAVRMMFGVGLVGIINTAVTTVVSVTYMVNAVDWTLTLAAVVPLPILAFGLTKLRFTIRKRFKRAQEAVSDLNAKTQENITGIRVVKAYAQEKSETETFSRLSKRKWASEMAMVRVSALIGPSTALVFGIVFSVFLMVGGRMVIDGTMNLGQYVAFNGYLALVVEPMNMISRIMTVWQRGRVSMGRLDQLFNEKPSVNDEKADKTITELEAGQLEVRDLTFSYPNTDKSSLKDVNFSVRQGQLLAVMGVTGSGKTTLANLILRLWPLEDGKVFLDGIDINQIPILTMRKYAAFVPQDSFLFSDTIAENIAFFDEDVTDEQVREAAKLACVDENIMAQPDGYDTVVGERGMTLSGGQKQRISIARALVRNPRLLLLDDCLSAVDAATEQAILKNLTDARGERITVFITHRISAAMAADNILLFNKDGSVAGIGSHEQLLRTNKAYNDLIELIKSRERGGDIR
ncbi:MAG TPA: ABC transporter ATP-binding protein [Oscillospiraceae bacterium]|nr:ABC transporter ATP-binding protein [Oscillospiraceae bacterium]HPK35702.1 ABC transporter ATP-binding protein [Oscillospiraceae bacterium]